MYPEKIKHIIEQGEGIRTGECKIDMLKSKSLQEIELLNEYKTSLMSDVVIGRIDVKQEVLN